MKSDALRIAARHERCARGRADAARDIEVRQSHAFVSEAVEGWCAVLIRAKAAQVSIAHVIYEDEDEVGLAALFEAEAGAGREEWESEEGGFKGVQHS